MYKKSAESQLSIKFILLFLVFYISLSVGYKLYLDFSKGSSYYPDYITHLVALQSKEIINSVGYNAEVIPHPDEPSMKLIINGKYLSRVIEGCNSISVIILFISFIVAFSGSLKTTFYYYSHKLYCLLMGNIAMYLIIELM